MRGDDVEVVPNGPGERFLGRTAAVHDLAEARGGHLLRSADPDVAALVRPEEVAVAGIQLPDDDALERARPGRAGRDE